MVNILGIPFDKNSSYLKGAAKAPDKIRQALRSESSNTSTEDLIDLGENGVINDLGNLDPTIDYLTIENEVSKFLINGTPLISLGGDHSITYPIIRAYSPQFEDITILHLDAHSDLYETYEGNKYSHACPFARIMEQQLVKKLVQVGIRTLTQHQFDQAKKYHVEIIDMKQWVNGVRPKIQYPVYLSLDLDVLDPEFAPGISHPEPGGLSTREVIHIIQSIPGPILGADIVELNPSLDNRGITAMLAAKLLKEICSNMIRNQA